MGGWIKIYDKILNWEWYSNTNVVRVFLHCLLKANYQQKIWQGIVIERGQFITSIATLSSETGLTPKQIRGTLTKLQKTNNVTIKGANKYSIITVCNYDSYQSDTNPKGQAKGQTSGQAEGQTKVTEKGNNIRYTYTTDTTELELFKNLTPKGDKTKKRKADNDFDIVGYLQSRGVTEQHIQDYLKVRKEKKAVNTLTAMQRIDTQIQLAHISWDEAVACCIEWDWKGFNHDWYIKKLQTQNNNGIYQSRQRQDNRRETPAPNPATVTEADMHF